MESGFGEKYVEALLIPCPHCSTTNRVPKAKLGQGGKCGKCKNLLFAGAPINLDGARFDAHADSDLPLLVDFWASWCGPCKAMAPHFEAAAKEFEPRLRLAKVNTDAEPELAARFQIQGIPTLVFLNKGREITRMSGALLGTQLRQWISQQLAAQAA
jgi:thioredoxin 2